MTNNKTEEQQIKQKLRNKIRKMRKKTNKKLKKIEEDRKNLKFNANDWHQCVVKDTIKPKKIRIIQKQKQKYWNGVEYI